MAAFALRMLAACKKDPEKIGPTTSTLDRWRLKKYRTRTFRNYPVVRDTSRLDFKAEDFELFNADGGGYTSNYTSNYTPDGET